MGVGQALCAYPHGNSQQAPERGLEPLRACLLPLAGLHARELPETCQQAPGRTLLHEHPSLPPDQGQGQLHLPDRGTTPRRWDPVSQLGPTRLAETLQGTGRAAGAPAGQADAGSQLHHRLVPITRGLGGHQPRRQALHRPPGLGRIGARLLGGPPGEHPEGVAVHGRQGVPEGDAHHRAGGVRPDPGQAAEPVRVVGNTLTGRHQLRGRLPEKPGAPVEAQALPRLQDLLLPCGRQGGQIREAFQEAEVVGDHRLHLGLLQHDLREPDPVGIPGPAPGQVPAVRPVPAQEPVLEDAAPRLRVGPGPGQLRHLLGTPRPGDRAPPGRPHWGNRPGGGLPGSPSDPAAACRNQGISPDSQAAFPRTMRPGAIRNPGSPKRVAEM